jgi:hypothetical protein
MGIGLVVDGDHLTVRLNGADRVFAIRNHLKVPLWRVTSVDVVARKEIPSTPGTWLRKPGTHIPGVVRYGSYGLQPNREFWAVYRQHFALVIEIEDWGYSRIVLGVKNAPLRAAEIRLAAEAHHPLAG